jgi:DNA-binding GntR family transcriptional regulator
MAAMGCSQGTVREALLRLEQDGLVTRRGYRGTVVSTTSLEEAAQMARIRIALEIESARRAGPRLYRFGSGALGRRHRPHGRGRAGP